LARTTQRLVPITEHVTRPANYFAVKRLYASSPEEQDLVVIGGGPGGYYAAIKAGQLGKKVTCIEKRSTLGGTCLNVGCIPSKALLNASHKYEEAKHEFDHYGIEVSDVKVNLEKMMKQKDTAVTGLTGGIKMLFKKYKVNGMFGFGKITGPNEVSVTADDGTETTLKAKNILIATGSDVASLPGLEIDEKTVVSSTGALKLDKVPEKMIVIGGGVIGLEMGSVWRRLGSQVTVVEFADAICAGADGEVAKKFQKVLEKQNMQFKMKTKVVEVKKREGGGHIVVVEPASGGEQSELEADVVLVSVGRRPYTDNLGLEDVGVETDKRGFINIDDKFVTSVKSIRAIGDCVRGPMLAHKAEDEGGAAVEDIFKGYSHVNYDAIPSVIYTHPEVAWVGKTEEQLKEEGISYKTGKFPMMANSRARTNDDADGFVKFLSDAKTDRLLGVHLVCSNAGELIAEPTFALEYGASSEDLGRTCHAHPTLSEALKEAAMATYDKPVHS